MNISEYKQSLDELLIEIIPDNMLHIKRNRIGILTQEESSHTTYEQVEVDIEYNKLQKIKAKITGKTLPKTKKVYEEVEKTIPKNSISQIDDYELTNFQERQLFFGLMPEECTEEKLIDAQNNYDNIKKILDDSKANKTYLKIRDAIQNEERRKQILEHYPEDISLNNKDLEILQTKAEHLEDTLNNVKSIDRESVNNPQEYLKLEKSIPQLEKDLKATYSEIDNKKETITKLGKKLKSIKSAEPYTPSQDDLKIVEIFETAQQNILRSLVKSYEKVRNHVAKKVIRKYLVSRYEGQKLQKKGFDILEYKVTAKDHHYCEGCKQYEPDQSSYNRSGPIKEFEKDILGLPKLLDWKQNTERASYYIKHNQRTSHRTPISTAIFSLATKKEATSAYKQFVEHISCETVEDERRKEYSVFTTTPISND